MLVSTGNVLQNFYCEKAVQNLSGGRRPKIHTFALLIFGAVTG
jgi:hypothetical protein